MQDLEVFKQIPGYKAILKAVLKNQIQSLVHQLAQQTGEESVLITASLEEGTLTQLGSEFGKTFLEGHDEIKSQFLGFCLKNCLLDKPVLMLYKEIWSGLKYDQRLGKQLERSSGLIRCLQDRLSGNQIQKQTKEFQESKPRKSWSARRPHAGLPMSTRSEPYPVSMTTAISRSANQRTAREEKSEHGRRKPSKTIKTETTFQYVAPDAEEYDASFTSFPTNTVDQDDSEFLENETKTELTPVTTVANGQIYVNNVMASKDSVSSMYTENSMDSMSQVENQSPESGTDTSDMATDEMVNESERIVAGQVNCQDTGLEQYSIKEEAFSAGQNLGQDHGIQGQMGHGEGHVKDEQLETADVNANMGTLQVHDVTSLKETIDVGKPKLKLFNRNRKSNMQKSLKERKAELENYLNLENTDRPYPCNLCPKRFKERHHLVYHLRTHSGHRPYVCSICNKGFTQSSSLNTHKKLHLKDMSCEFCGLVFRKISLLQNHVCRALSDLNSTV